MKRGICQGCLSVMLFVIAVEMLAVKIHNNSQISSICLKMK